MATSSFFFEETLKMKRILSFKSKCILGTIIFLVFIQAALRFLIWGLIDWKNCVNSPKWPLAKGQVILSEVKAECGSGSNNSRIYRVKIEYEYWVNNKRYVSDRIHATRLPTSSEQSAETLVAQYPRGKEITPAYNPEAPWFAVLEPGLHGEDLIGLYAGIASTSICAFIGISVFRRRKAMKLELAIRQAVADSQKLRACPSFRVQVMQDNDIHFMVNKTLVDDVSIVSLRTVLEAHGISITTDEMDKLKAFIALVANGAEKFNGNRIELIHVLSLIKKGRMA